MNYLFVMVMYMIWGITKGIELSPYYREGKWHSIVGLLPQYQHMKGSLMYSYYIAGYNRQ